MWKAINYIKKFDEINENNNYKLIELNMDKKFIIYEHLYCGTKLKKTLDLFRLRQGCNNKECIVKKRNQVVKEKYGVKNAFQSKEIKEKIKKINLEKYGVDNPAKSEKVKEKIKKTNLKKYGVEYTLQAKEVRNKIKKTNLKKYGVDNPAKSEEIKEKIKKTNLKRYGSSCSLGSKESIIKRMETWLNKYGYKYPWQSKQIKDKKRKNKLKKIFINKILKLKNVKPLFSIEEYKGVKEKHQWKCLKCNNEFEDDLYAGSLPRCPICYPYLNTGISIIEKEIKTWLKNYIKIKENKRFSKDSKYLYELDIYVSDKKLGIELNGIYWHSEKAGRKNKNYHLNKTNFFKKMDIQVIHIFDNEWIDKQDIIKSIILNKIGLSNKKVYARNCKVLEVSNNVVKEFLEKNHLQGQINSKINIGLFYNEKLIEILCFGKSRYNKKYEWELLRFCNKLNYNVVGGFSKGLKYFLNNYSTSLITYADKRFSEGNLYLNNGFKLITTAKPNYFYTKDYKTLESRIQYQKHKLKEKLKFFDSNFTEWENMQMNGYDRIWDCGNLVFEYISV